jgi:MFS family permease
LKSIEQEIRWVQRGMRFRTSPKVFAALCSISAGLLLNEQLCNNVIPLSLRHFTPNAGLIGLILAIHPAFGFLVQPMVGILGDRIWTRVGRRATFLVVCAPLAAVCLALMARASGFWSYLAPLVLFQFFFAILWGSDHPLIAELAPAAQRPLVKGGMLAGGQISSFFFVTYGVGRAMDRWGEPSVYWIVAAGQILLVMVAALFLGESRVTPTPRPKLTPARYVRDLWGDPVLRRFAVLGFAYAAFVSSVAGFMVLFAVRTLRLSRADFGSAWGSQCLLAIVCAIPIGFAVTRSPKQWALVAGFACSLLACLIALRSDAGRWIYPIALLFGTGVLTIDVTLPSFLSEYLPRDIIGQLMGAYNICYAAGRIVALIGTGWVVAAAHGDYRVIWIVAIGFGALGAIVAATIPDRRWQRSKGRGASPSPQIMNRPIAVPVGNS